MAKKSQKQLQPTFDFDQSGLFKPKDGSQHDGLYLESCTHDCAEYAVNNWHYSRTLPKGSIPYAVWEDNVFLGCVIFGQGANRNIANEFLLGNKYGGDSERIVSELIRVALREHKAFATRIIRLAIRAFRLANPSIRLLVSYADPMHGHIGKIYQAGNWVFTGYSESISSYFIDGQVMHGRDLWNKYGTQNIDVLKQHHPDASLIPNKPKLRYAYPLDKEMRKYIQMFWKPYPKTLS